MRKYSFTLLTALLPLMAWTGPRPFFSGPVRGISKMEKSKAYSPGYQENEPPQVTILSPKDHESYPLNSRVPYKISVSDKEDGESKYDEIASGEVLVEVTYMPPTETKNFTNVKPATPDPGLLGIAASNCLLCHAFKGNLIGPSFYEIAQKYQHTKPDPDTVANRVMNGSTGVWGDKVMPSHPELTLEEIKAMLHWINQNAAQEGKQYYHGLEGTVELNPDSPSAEKVGVFVITSYYRDHGFDGALKKIGIDQVILEVTE